VRSRGLKKKKWLRKVREKIVKWEKKREGSHDKKLNESFDGKTKIQKSFMRGKK